VRRGDEQPSWLHRRWLPDMAVGMTGTMGGARHAVITSQSRYVVE
jgi:hypothetical protein